MAFICAYSAVVSTSALAQTAPPHDVKHAPEPAPSRAAAPDASPQAKAAFLALSAQDRRALQEALGWAGYYVGVDDGGYGKRKMDALRAYQQAAGAAGDGVVTAKTLADLKEKTAKAQAAVGFKTLDDPATGIRIGAPTKLLEKREGGVGFTSLASKDGGIRLDLKETTGKLAALFKFLTADAPGHKFTYKAMKPDAWFVIAGEEGDKKFYRRYAAAPADAPDPDKLRGFVFVYPKAMAEALDPVSLAVANSFEPFPASPTAAPSPPKLAATALIVAPGVALSALDPAQCKSPTVAGKPAQFLAPLGALARLGGDFGAGASAPPIGADSGELVALSLSPRATLTASLAQRLDNAKVIAALGVSGSGAPLFDRQGRLVAFVGAIASAPRRAGVALAAPHAAIPAPAALGEAGAASLEALSAFEIARLRRSAVVGVFCAS